MTLPSVVVVGVASPVVVFLLAPEPASSRRTSGLAPTRSGLGFIGAKKRHQKQARQQKERQKSEVVFQNHVCLLDVSIFDGKSNSLSKSKFDCVASVVGVLDCQGDFYDSEPKMFTESLISLLPWADESQSVKILFPNFVFSE